MKTQRTVVLVVSLTLLALAWLNPARAATTTLTAATGGGSISADSAVNGATPGWTTLGAITLAEGGNGDFAVGTGVTLVLKTPAGFQFNTAVTPDVTFTLGRGIASAAAAMTDASTLTVTLTVTNATSLDTLTIGSVTGLQVQPTAATPLATGKHIYRPNTGGGTATIAGITANADGAGGSNFGALTEVAAAAALVRVETAANGSGTVVPAQNVGAGTSLTVYAVARDQYGNNVGNIAADTWSLVNETGGVVNGDLVPAGNAKSAVFTGHALGSAAVHVTSGALTSTDSGTLTVVAGTATKLFVTLPGQTFVSGVGNTGTPLPQTSGTAFVIANLTATDNYTNLATSYSGAKTVSYTGPGGTASYTTAVSFTAGQSTTTLNTTLTKAETVAITATITGVTAVPSSSLIVNPGAFAKLQLLAPGETAAPGTATGKTGTPTARTAGTAFNVTVNAVDANWNLVNTVADTVALTSSDATAVLPLNTPLVNGTVSLSATLNDAGTQTLTASDASDATKTASTSANLTVNAGAFVGLQLLLPGETAAPGTPTGKTGTPTAQTAGTAFNVIVNAVDANWNVVATANGPSYSVKLTASDSHATVPGNKDLQSGTATLSVTFKTAGTATLTAADVDDATKTPSTSPSVTVNTGVFTKLQVLMPGETADPGATSGKTGTPSAQTAGVPFDVTVNAVDANWNPIATNDTVHLTSSDANAMLPADAALVGGTVSLNVTLKMAGARTVTAADMTHTGITANTGANTTLNAGPFAQLQVLLPGEAVAAGTLTGKTGAPTARTAGTAFNATVNAVDAFWNLVSTNPVIAISSSDLNATLPANAALANGTKNFSVTFKTAGSQTVTATDQTDPTAPATSSAVTVNAGAVAKLQLLVPGETAAPGTATGKTGTPLAQTSNAGFSITVNSVDANWNLASATDTIRIYSSDPAAHLPPNAALVAGTQAFSVTLLTAGTSTLTASNVTHNTITASTSPAISVNSHQDQTITFGALVAKTYGNAPFVVSATASSGLPVTLSVLSGPAAITGNTVTLTGVGLVTLRASQAGNGTFNPAPNVDQAFTVNRAALTAAADNASRAYGQANPPFSVTWFGFVNGETATVLTGTPQITTSAETNSPVGAYDLVLAQGSLSASNYTFAGFTNGTLTVTPATLTVTADDQSRLYGVANPALTVHYTGFVNGQDATLLSGTPQVTTPADLTSPVGRYSIIPALGTLKCSDTNYSFAFVSGTLAVTVANSALAVSSSANPSLPGANVTFTATLSAVAPAGGTPGGVVTFVVDGAVLGAPAPLTGGLASLTTAALTHGTHVVVAQYAGDSNFLGSTNSLNPSQVVNTPPAAGPLAWNATQNQTTNWAVSTLLAACTDADSDPLSITAVGPTSAHGGTVSLAGGTVSYTPPGNYTGADSFSYTVRDSYGATTPGTVTVTVQPAIVPPPTITRITRQSNGNVQLDCTGMANQAYCIQASSDLSTWTSLKTNTADANGHWSYPDTAAPSYSVRFYRLKVP